MRVGLDPNVGQFWFHSIYRSIVSSNSPGFNNKLSSNKSQNIAMWNILVHWKNGGCKDLILWFNSKSNTFAEEIGWLLFRFWLIATFSDSGIGGALNRNTRFPYKNHSGNIWNPYVSFQWNQPKIRIFERFYWRWQRKIFLEETHLYKQNLNILDILRSTVDSNTPDRNIVFNISLNMRGPNNISL